MNWIILILAGLSWQDQDRNRTGAYLVVDWIPRSSYIEYVSDGKSGGKTADWHGLSRLDRYRSSRSRSGWNSFLP